MKIRFTLFALLFYPLLVFSATIPSSIQSNAPSIKKNINQPFNLYTLTTLKIKEFEKYTGQKLTLKEKIAFKIFQWKISRNMKATGTVTKDNGKTAFILGLIGLIVLVIPVLNLASIPLAIMAIVIGNKAKRENPGDRKARTAVKLGILTLALLLVIGFMVAIVLAFGTIGPR